MDAERWQRVQTLLEGALALPSEERGAYLTRECAEAELRAEVESLLAASFGAQEYFEDLAGRAALSADPSADCAPPDLIGRRIGAYRLERFLGRGGMGSVYLGQRDDQQFAQRAAIKLLSLGTMEGEGHRRFLAEREILARLQHPHIARLFDGGVAEDGTPYFVMEYVEGERIDRFCEREALSLAERLQPFLEVCDAVAHAHRNLVVHRDLKPANILVTADGVRLLDFGIAKLLGEGADRQRTLTGRSALTPAYASPEQVLGRAITTATDVYALGVLLYELLSGFTPYEVEGDSPLAIFKEICEAPRTAPSARVCQALEGGAGSDEVLERRARARQLSPGGLVRALRGDLDTIVLKALHIDPAERYESVEALAEDIRRHLDGRPVLARRPSLGYRAARFFGRHRLAASLGTLAVLLLSALVSVSLWFAVSSAHQTRLIEQERGTVQEFLAYLTELYESADPEASPGTSRAARGVLDEAVRRLEGLSAADPETRATLLFAAGRVYRRLGLGEEAQPLLEESLELRRARHDPPHEALAEVTYELGSSLTPSGAGASRGRALLEETLGMELELHGRDHLHVAQARFALGSILHNVGEGARSVQEYNEAVRIFRLHPEERTDECADALLGLGDLQAVGGDIAGATSLYEEGLEIYEELYGHTHPAVARALVGLGMLFYNSQRQQEGIALLQEAAEIQASVFGEEPNPARAMTLQNLGALMAAEDDPEGIAILREATEIHAAHSPLSAVDLGFCLTQLGDALRNHDRLEEARAAYERSLETFAAHDVDAMFQASAKLSLATLLRREGRSERAIELLAEVLESYRARLPEDHPRVTGLRRQLDEARGD